MFDTASDWNPEKNLWREVLYRFVSDALEGAKEVLGRDAKIRLCQEARTYLTRPSRDLSMVCNLAGLEMQPVIDRMKAQIAKAPTPEELVARSPAQP